MRKAKIILTAIFILGIISGAVAFKLRTAHTFYKLNQNNGQCNVPVQLFYTLTFTGGFLTQLDVSPTTDPCPVIRLTVSL
ncbi:hypothetical protein [Chitinophaga japonensis]|uniref:hypothetical protein n=1 Tax=Chitinophaga japonensis TaxID=104662 RepID=UPI0011A8B7C9|nr:hypothetical protein [Chitinophaga japonensis]